MSAKLAELSQLFLERWPNEQTERAADSSSPAARSVDEGQLGAALGEALAAARAAWPELAVGDEQFVSYVAERLADTSDPLESLKRLNTVDLYLACACAHGSSAAIEVFGERYQALFKACLANVGIRGADADEAIRRVNEQLLVPRSDGLAPIALYGGHGELRSYLRVVVTRTGARMLREQRRQPLSFELDRLEQASSLDDPELGTIKNRYREQFKAAFHQAIASLESSERNLLRYHYVHALTTREIGKAVGASSPTVTRRLARVRAKLSVRTRNELVATLKLDKAQFDSMLRLIESQLDLSISRVLDSSTGTPLKG